MKDIFEKFNEKITIRFNVLSDKSKVEILERIVEGKKNYSWSDFLSPNAIEYNAIDVYDNRLEINGKYTLLNLLKAVGKITIRFKNVSDNKTDFNVEILPYHGKLPYMIALGLLIVTAWSFFVWLIFFFTKTTILFYVILLAPWVLPSISMYCKYLYTKHRLINYSKRIINELTKDK
jgi:hypothetical protein